MERGADVSAAWGTDEERERSPDAAYSLVRTYDAERMRIVQSGAEKRDLLGASV